MSRTARPLGPILEKDMTRFWAKVLLPDVNGCLLWDGTTTDGYGRFSLNRSMVYAHRVAWEYLIGPVPLGLELDHVFARGCRSKLCVNIEHLEAITHAENNRRGYTARRWRAGIWVRTVLDDDMSDSSA